MCTALWDTPIAAANVGLKPIILIPPLTAVGRDAPDIPPNTGRSPRGVCGPKLSMGARLEIIHGLSLVIVLSILIPSAGRCARIASAI